MVKLGHRGDGGFATTSRSALLNGDRGGNARDAVDSRFASRLHDASCVGVK